MHISLYHSGTDEYKPFFFLYIQPEELCVHAGEEFIPVRLESHYNLIFKVASHLTHTSTHDTMYKRVWVDKCVRVQRLCGPSATAAALHKEATFTVVLL